MPHSFEKGNQIWQLRSKHGRDVLFADPELLWKEAVEYFKWCDDNPILVDDVRGKDAEHVDIVHRRPYTLHGLCIYLDCGINYLRQFKTSDAYKNNGDYSLVISRIEECIYDQKFTGASIGIFNHNIIARDLGLADKKEFDARIDDRRKSLDELFPPIDDIRDKAKEADK